MIKEGIQLGLQPSPGQIEQEGKELWQRELAGAGEGGGLQTCLGGELLATQKIAESREDGIGVALAWCDSRERLRMVIFYSNVLFILVIFLNLMALAVQLLPLQNLVHTAGFRLWLSKLHNQVFEIAFHTLIHCGSHPIPLSVTQKSIRSLIVL